MSASVLMRIASAVADGGIAADLFLGPMVGRLSRLARAVSRATRNDRFEAAFRAVETTTLGRKWSFVELQVKVVRCPLEFESKLDRV